ncbi:hypothetical protein T492DRAFT_1023866, partial [Pavlovales sp. CCMP2436]
MQTMDALFSEFQTENVLCGTPLSYSSFKKLAPWNLRRINRETCLCRTCELYKCAYFAKVFSAAAAIGEGGIYTVEKPNGERVEVQRHLLRHRSIKTIAFGCITNDEHHDGAASQHFINKV